MERREGVSPWEKFWIEGSYGSITGDLERATRAYKVLLELYPTHDWAVGNLNNVTGRLNRPFEAVPYAAGAADLRPYDRLAVEEAAFSTLEAGDFSHARRYMEQLRTIRSNSAADISAAEVGIVEAWAAWQRGEAKECQAASRPGHARLEPLGLDESAAAPVCARASSGFTWRSAAPRTPNEWQNDDG